MNIKIVSGGQTGVDQGALEAAVPSEGQLKIATSTLPFARMSANMV